MGIDGVAAMLDVVTRCRDGRVQQKKGPILTTERAEPTPKATPCVNLGFGLERFGLERFGLGSTSSRQCAKD